MLEKAYLDIETSFGGEITILGIFRPPDELIQIVQPDISRRTLLGALDGVREIVTYWGHRFDLPVISRCLRVNLRRRFESKDLADHCHRHGLFGGLKAVEKSLGILRQTAGLTGMDAMQLWEHWLAGNREALRILLKYNEEDVVNLYLIEKEIFRFDAEAESREPSP
ncbi:MAG TPA: ribonuclease H-like domain-containing protein [bacterium]|nr:ribonuclease H-like domain-containing protein [bacterium]